MGSQVEEVYSLQDIKSLDKIELEQKIFYVIPEESGEQPLQYSQLKTTEIQLQGPKKFFQIKLKSIKVEGRDLTMYQLLDKSNFILYDKMKMQKSILEHINSCIQHEIKNPINSIVA